MEEVDLHISEATLIRLELMTKKICSVADLVPDSLGGYHHDTPGDNCDPRLPAMMASPGRSIGYTSLASRKYPGGSCPAEITQHSMDATF